MKSRKAKLANIALLLESSAFALLLRELGCCLFLNPPDYLSEEIEKVNVLGVQPGVRVKSGPRISF